MMNLEVKACSPDLGAHTHITRTNSSKGCIVWIHLFILVWMNMKNDLKHLQKYLPFIHVLSLWITTIDISQGDIEFFDSYYQAGYHLQFTLLLTFEMIDALYFVNLLG